MNDTLRGMERRKRTWTLMAWALLVLSPWIQLAVISLVTGKNAFLTYPVWSDELDYWRSLHSWINVGFSKGYNGIGEFPSIIGTLSVHGITPLLLYGGFCKLFGLAHFSIVICNAVWVSLGALVFCALVKPRASVAAFIASFLMVFVPAVLYATTSMTELFNYALLLFYAAFLVHYGKTKKKWSQLLCWATVIFACLYRITYLILFIPLLAVGCEYRLSRKLVWQGLLALLVIVGTYVISAVLTAPYPSGFLYNWLRVEDLATFVQMFLSHGKANLYDYFVRYTDSPMEDAIRQLYCIAMVWTLVASVVRVELAEKRLRLKLGFDKTYFGGFLLLFVPFALVVMIYETNDWSDFRTLSPILWGVIALLAVQKKKALPAVILAGSVAMLISLCTMTPIGAFQDEYRFTSPPYYEEVQEACESIQYDPDATDPYANSVRSDLATFQVMQQVDPAMGLWFGWFTPETTGKSRWVLTDHLKIVMEDYAPVYGDRGAKVYRKITENQQ